MSSSPVKDARVILLDIEGTTTPMDFVHRTLFDYARKNIESFLVENWESEAVQKAAGEMKAQWAEDSKAGREPPAWEKADAKPDAQEAAMYAKWLIGRDSKLGALKLLQGMIWEKGYREGELKGEVYPDVPAAMERWKKAGKRICIYSSGSALAQKLIFSTTAYGDLTAYISSFYDTTVGHKRDPASYQKIAASEGVEGNGIAFFSDVPEELEAADKSGFITVLVERERVGARLPESGKFYAVRDFNSL